VFQKSSIYWNDENFHWRVDCISIFKSKKLIAISKLLVGALKLARNHCVSKNFICSVLTANFGYSKKPDDRIDNNPNSRNISSPLVLMAKNPLHLRGPLKPFHFTARNCHSSLSSVHYSRHFQKPQTLQWKISDDFPRLSYNVGRERW